MASSSSNFERLRGDGTSGLFQLGLTAASARPAAPGSATMRGRLGVLARRGFAAMGGPGTPAPPGGFKQPPVPESLAGVSRVIAVASGKGGVGKSTTAVNLACATAAMGLRVGLLDADVFGPSVPLLMNLADAGAPLLDSAGRMLPLENHGVRGMSLGFLIPPESAAVWRGPMVMGALGKMVRETAWAPIDILFVDMPPGTGDAQISISQRLPLTGAVIVSTPQEIALADARRGVDMYAKVNAPILGFVENMAYFVGPGGERTYVFGKRGVRRTAEESGVELLGEVPLEPALAEASDRGAPPAAAAPESDVGKLYAAMARRLIEQTKAFAFEGVGVGEEPAGE